MALAERARRTAVARTASGLRGLAAPATLVALVLALCAESCRRRRRQLRRAGRRDARQRGRLRHASGLRRRSQRDSDTSTPEGATALGRSWLRCGPTRPRRSRSRGRGSRRWSGGHVELRAATSSPSRPTTPSPASRRWSARWSTRVASSPTSSPLPRGDRDQLRWPPEELEEGVYALTMLNDGAEPHVVVVFRKNDGEKRSAEELLALQRGGRPEGGRGGRSRVRRAGLRGSAGLVSPMATTCTSARSRSAVDGPPPSPRAVACPRSVERDRQASRWRRRACTTSAGAPRSTARSIGVGTAGAGRAVGVAARGAGGVGPGGTGGPAARARPPRTRLRRWRTRSGRSWRRSAGGPTRCRADPGPGVDVAGVEVCDLPRVGGVTDVDHPDAGVLHRDDRDPGVLAGCRTRGSAPTPARQSRAGPGSSRAG